MTSQSDLSIHTSFSAGTPWHRGRTYGHQRDVIIHQEHFKPKPMYFLRNVEPFCI